MFVEGKENDQSHVTSGIPGEQCAIDWMDSGGDFHLLPYSHGFHADTSDWIIIENMGTDAFIIDKPDIEMSVAGPGYSG